MELVKALRLRAAIFDRSPYIKRTAKICFGLIVAVFVFQFCYVWELLLAEVVAAFGFVVCAADRRSICPWLHRGFMVAKAPFWAQALGAHVCVLGSL